jgi:Acyl-coenzyme A oxidase N-terminal
MTAIRHGSIKNKVVASDLEEERKHLNFDQRELTNLVWGGPHEHARILDLVKDMEADPVLKCSEKWYDYSREEQQEVLLQRMRKYYDLYRDKYFTNFKQHMTPWWTISFQGLVSPNLV